MNNFFSTILDFFNPLPEDPNNNDFDFVSIFQLAFIAIATIVSLYLMHGFAYSGMAGSIGLGIILLFWFAAPVVVKIISASLKARSFLPSLAVIIIAFFYFVSVNLSVSKPPRDASMQEALKAASGNQN